MSYMALYRKFRPDQFDEVKGQEHIVTTLKNQLMADRIGHAYLFCGTRGTGKTTVAKLFAKAVNCEHPIDGSPCGTCSSCRAIAEGSSMNVIEIDAASNNGVDNIREIREQVRYSPTEGKYKVYIIDEVHMLSIGAFNALLKTLEEPPSYVIFILATTEAHKIPITILSRCQRYDFRRISIQTIADRLQDLMEREHVSVEEKAIRYIAKAADGSMRDALSLLDQCIAFYLGQKLTYDKVLEVLGVVDTEIYQKLIGLVMEQNTSGVLDCIEEIIWQGKDLSQFVTDFMWYLRNMLLIKSGDVPEDALDISGNNLEIMKQNAQKLDSEVLMRYIRILSELLNELKQSTSKRVLTEVAFIKLCKPQMERNYDSILDRLRQIEKQMEEMAKTPLASQTVLPKEMMEEPAAPEIDLNDAVRKKFEPATIKELQKIAEGWSQIQRKLPPRLKYLMNYSKMVVKEDSESLCLLFPNTPDGEDGKMTFERAGRIQQLEEEISNLVQRKVRIECRLMEKTQVENRDYFDLSKIKMEVEFQDD
ncbi:MAG TPA: DNA polymerase III subunit gamma/tau [Candidatus Fimousia stercorigallinarum]|nr:DNA polymerase III subunit gamma/tau [Candidatus Fimousia stercorigallinarum]